MRTGISDFFGLYLKYPGHAVPCCVLMYPGSRQCGEALQDKTGTTITPSIKPVAIIRLSAVDDNACTRILAARLSGLFRLNLLMAGVNPSEKTYPLSVQHQFVPRYPANKVTTTAG